MKNRIVATPDFKVIKPALNSLPSKVGKELSHAAFSFEANVAIDSFVLEKE
jgi:hypothetical protein